MGGLWSETSPHLNAKPYRGKDLWCVEINSLEELMEYVDIEQEIVISTVHKDENMPDPIIEIYDDYRE